MKKLTIFLTSVAVLLASCASTKPTEKAADKIRPVIGAEGVERPAWVFSGMESPDGIYAVGSSGTCPHRSDDD